MDIDIGKLYGVGAKRRVVYEKLGIRNVDDLLLHFPRGYEDRGTVLPLSAGSEDEKKAYLLTVATEPRINIIKGRMSLLKFRAFDESASVEITYFNQNYLKEIFSVGAEFRFYGKLERKGNKLYMSSPVYEPISDEVELRSLISVYRLTEGLSQKQISKDVKNALTLYSASGEEDFLPEGVRISNGLCTEAYALRNIHCPESFSALSAAKKRLIYDEFFTFALGLSLERQKKEKASASPCSENDISDLLSLLPYELTDAQKRVIGDIKNDMSKHVAMNRIIVGDVGSGKTICAAAAMLIAVRSGKQAALMAPTEILARQHYQDIGKLFEKLGISCELLVGSMTKSQKQRVHKGLSESDPSRRINIVIGTQALISEGVEFFDGGLVITDEQHRFGVSQRATLAEKNKFSHTLVMSATPIPRTLALTIYGDLDISVIDEMPKGRQRVDTFVVDEGYRQRLDAFIVKQVEGGGQVYIVCPAVENAEEDGVDLFMEDIDSKLNSNATIPIHSVVSLSEELSEKFKGISVEFIHGKLKSAQKEDIMSRFANGEIKILVSTTVIEVGVNVPNACLMIVENAERFGLSQLHQLRGRVGRGSRKSYCVLVSSTEGETAKERLSVMKSCYDGYAIAERDLALRGPGDFLRSNKDASLRQSGDVQFRLADMCDDLDLMQKAFADARALVEQDPRLESTPTLMDRVRNMFTLIGGTIN